MASDLLREVDYLLSLDPRVIGADKHVQELLRDLATEYERLREALEQIKSEAAASWIADLAEAALAAPEGATDE